MTDLVACAADSSMKKLLLLKSVDDKEVSVMAIVAAHTYGASGFLWQWFLDIQPFHRVDLAWIVAETENGQPLPVASTA